MKMTLRIRLIPAAVASCLWLATACGASGSYVWYHDLPKTEWDSSPGEYLINVGDGLTVTVYAQEALTSPREPTVVLLPRRRSRGSQEASSALAGD
jgi:hypothetical protein